MSVDSTGTSGPLAEYRRLLNAQAIQPDPVQATIVERMDALWLELDRAPSLIGRLKGRWFSSEPVRGLYLWGGVGRGKTWLMDLFFDSLDVASKERLHFEGWQRPSAPETGRPMQWGLPGMGGCHAPQCAACSWLCAS